VTYAFDKAGRMSSLSDWASRSTSYTYAADGLPKGSTNANSTTTTYSYDNARRLLEILHEASGGADIEHSTYTLDALGNVSRLVRPDLLPVDHFARPDGVAGVSGTWTGTYTDMDETTASDTDFIASPSNPVSGTYYEATLGDIAGPASVSDVTVRYRYAKSANGGKQIDLTVELRQGNTVIATASHSNISGSWTAGSITLTATQRAAITNWSDLRLRFSPTTSGNGSARTAQISWAEVEVTGYANAGSDDTYSYDQLYRLTGTSGTGGSHTYTYDPVGNRLSYVAGSTTNYTYDRADRITAAGATSITVNAVGATTAKGSDSFSYDQANRLTSATVSGTTETYTYDGDGVRFSRQVGAGAAIRYVTDPNRGLPVTIGDGTRKYVWGLGLAYAVNGSAIEVYHQDRLGSTRVLTDGSGNTVATYRTDEFGNATGSTGTSAQPFIFTGEPRDGTGLSYLRARYYDPGLGRLMSRDTWLGYVGSPTTLGRYTYVECNPATNRDPSGRTSTLGALQLAVAAAKPKVLATQDTGTCLPVTVAATAGLVVMGVVDGLLGVATIVGAPSLVAEVALVPADIAAIYATGYLITLIQQGVSVPCDQVGIRNPANPFGG
jgi:RHS repeat-associated protein